jgi:hypothetical protein
MPDVMPKSNPLARRASGSSALKAQRAKIKMDFRLRGNDGKEENWIPAFAGMTNQETHSPTEGSKTRHLSMEATQ